MKTEKCKAKDAETLLNKQQIATMDEFKPLPFGTLNSIYHGELIPKKWYRRFDIRIGPPMYRPVVALVEEGDKDIIGGLTAEQRRIALVQYAEKIV